MQLLQCLLIALQSPSTGSQLSSTLPPSPTSTPALATHRQPGSAEVKDPLHPLQPFQAGAWSQSHVGPGQAGGQRGGGGQDQPEVEGQAAEGVPQCQVLSQAAPNQELVDEQSTLLDQYRGKG